VHVRSANTAEKILSRVTTPERAAAIVGDLAEEARKRGTLWFWFHVFRTAVSHFRAVARLSEEQRLGLIFGLISGAVWIGLFVLGNLRENHTGIYRAPRGVGLGGLLIPAITGLSAAYRMGGSMRAALRVGLLSGFISGVICLLTIVPITILFHGAMTHDALAGGLNMLWVGPLLGLTIGALGAFFGKAIFRGDRNAV
jgi:hypothetical protein